MESRLKLETTRMLATIDELGIAWVTFNHPERHNALSLDMWQAMGDIFEQLDVRDDVRVAVMTGAGGKAFVSGADISEFDKQRASSEQRAEYGKIAGRGTKAMARFRKPLIAMIDGYCIGGGLATALAADIRFATPQSSFGIPAARLGLGYEYDGLATLCRLVGPAVASDIMFSARFFPTSEAQAMGIVNFSYSQADIRNQVTEYAARIAGNAPLTIRAAKSAVSVWSRGEADGRREAVMEQVNACFDSDDYKEGRKAFAEKRAPNFRGK